MVVTVRFADDPDVETLLLAHREEAAYPDLEICSPDSPLGRALSGAREGQQCQYRLPGGDMMSVRLIRAVPYRD
jgi:transcription elongation factor GreA